MTLRAFSGHYIPHMTEERLSINQGRVNGDGDIFFCPNLTENILLLLANEARC
jgi:hypothetical protein